MCDVLGYVSGSPATSSRMGLSRVIAARGSEAMRPVQIDHVLDGVSMLLQYCKLVQFY